MLNDPTILSVVVAFLVLLAVVTIVGYWFKKKIDAVDQAINNTDPANRSGSPNLDHQTARRNAAMRMFYTLMVGVGALVVVLIFSARNLPDDEFVGGIILTAIAGGIGSLLSLIGIIVKGIMDKLTQEDPRDENRN